MTLFLFIFFWFLFKNEKFLASNLYLFFLTLLTLFKIYPLVILFGVIVYKLISKDYENIKKITTVSLINTAVLLWYYNSPQYFCSQSNIKVNLTHLVFSTTLLF